MKISQKGKPDFILLFLVFVLVGFGLLMVFSSSSIVSITRYQNPWFFTIRQSIWAFLGLVSMFILMNIHYSNFKKWFLPIFTIVIILLILVLLIGTSINGHRSWFSFRSFGIQPAEFAKLGLIIYLAALINKKGDQFQSFKKGLRPILLIIGLVLGLVMLQPDIGSSIIILLGALTLLIAGGANLFHLAIIALCASPLALYIVTSHSYRIQRFTTFLHPWDDTQNGSYQLVQSLFAFGHGGLYGTGLGQSIEKLFYLPEAYNDFIFSIIGEELGFMGVVLFIMVYVLFLLRCIMISLRCKDEYGTLLGVGIISLIGFQALINMGGVTGSIPVTGVTLPFISYGGSSLLLCLSSIGIILNISRENNIIIN
jgi:cell division protein FtsW